jgi:hypothetical protein
MGVIFNIGDEPEQERLGKRITCAFRNPSHPKKVNSPSRFMLSPPRI